MIYLIILVAFHSCSILNRAKVKREICQNVSDWILPSSKDSSEVFCKDTLLLLSSNKFSENDEIILNPTFYFRPVKLFKNRDGTGITGMHNYFLFSFHPIKYKPEGGVSRISCDEDIGGYWKVGICNSKKFVFKKIRSQKNNKNCDGDKELKRKIVYSIVHLDNEKMILVRKKK